QLPRARGSGASARRTSEGAAPSRPALRYRHARGHRGAAGAGSGLSHRRIAAVTMDLRITGLKTLPEVHPGDRLAELIRDAARREQQPLGERTILVIAQKIVSKAEGAMVDLQTVQPSEFAR